MAPAMTDPAPPDDTAVLAAATNPEAVARALEGERRAARKAQNEAEAHRRRADEAATEAEDLRRELMRVETAADLGLPLALAPRLIGTTSDELRADAAKFMRECAIR